MSSNPAHGKVYSIQHYVSQWFSPGTPDSSTNKTDCHDITEILLKVSLNTITLTLTDSFKGNNSFQFETTRFNYKIKIWNQNFVVNIITNIVSCHVQNKLAMKYFFCFSIYMFMKKRFGKKTNNLVLNITSYRICLCKTIIFSLKIIIQIMLKYSNRVD